MIALLLGTVLAVAALGFVLLPLFADPTAARHSRRDPGASLAASTAPEAATSAVEALREIEFDRATGKLSEADYASLKTTYTRQALAEMRAADSAAALDSLGDAAEQAVLRYRARRTSCPDHGARPEADASYCSECGRYLKGACTACGAAVTEPGARFCSACGAVLAA